MQLHREQSDHIQEQIRKRLDVCLYHHDFQNAITLKGKKQTYPECNSEDHHHKTKCEFVHSAKT